jgi:hypothetical protein
VKTVLLLAFYFPPRNHVAGYRSGCFAKFLPENGWLPTVLCQDWPPGGTDFDPDFVGVIPPEVQIHRVPSRPPVGFHQKFVLRKIAPFIWPQRMPCLWWQDARARILSLRQSRRFDAVWATSDPLVPLALAAETARAEGIPWVADIRDSFNVQRWGSWYKRPFFAAQERRLCAQADRVVAVSEGLARGLGGRIGREITVIHNGFDPTLLPESLPPPTPRFTIVHAGNIGWPHGNPAPLLQAVELALRRNLIPKDRIEVQFYSADPALLERAFPGAFTRLPLKVLPRLPHQAMLKMLMASSVLLLLSQPRQKGVLTGKVFDYLAARRPILAVPDDHGETAALLRRTGAGIAITGAEDILRQLLQWHAFWQAGADAITDRNESEIARYSRRTQTKYLAAILNDITRAGPQRS